MTRLQGDTEATLIVLALFQPFRAQPVDGAGYPAAGRGVILPEGSSSSAPLIGFVTTSR